MKGKIMKTVDEMANLICDFVKTSSKTFGEIENLFKENHFEFRGSLALASEYKNVHFWYGWNEEAIGAMMKAQELGCRVCPISPMEHFLICAYDGLPNWGFPIANYNGCKRGYKTEHWYPVIIVYGTTYQNGGSINGR